MAFPQLTIAFVGDKHVGKTSLAGACIGKKFESNYNPTIEDTHFCSNATISAQEYQLKILEFAASHITYPLSAIDAKVMVYDISNEESFKFIDKWMQLYQSAAPTILLANKCDLFPIAMDRDNVEQILVFGYCRSYGLIPNDVMVICFQYYGQKISGDEYGKEKNMFYFEVSAKSRMNVDDAFNLIAEKAKIYNELSSLHLIEPAQAIDSIPTGFDIHPLGAPKDHENQSCPCLLL